MDELRQTLTAVAASLQVLAANTVSNTQDLQRMAQDLQRMSDRSRQTEEEVRKLNGTFASLEQHLVKLFENDAETRLEMADLSARVTAIEKRLPAP